MRVLHICQRDDPDIGGSLSVLTALVAAQRAAGVDAWVLFLYGKSGPTVQRFSPNVVLLELESSRQALSGTLKLKKEIERISPDLVHSHDGIFWPRFAYWRVSVPIVNHAHLPPANSNGLKGKIGWRLTKNTSDAVIGISTHTMNAWVDAGYPAERIHLVPNGVDFERFQPLDTTEKMKLRNELGLPVSKKIILWVGRLHKEMKGTDRVERVANALPPDVVLVVVGNGPEYEGMKTRSKQLIENETLIMAGTSSEPESFYKAADAFLFTSYFEPFGLVILEAVASGLPIMAFPVPRGGGAIELLKKYEALEAEDNFSESELRSLAQTLLSEEHKSSTYRTQALKEYSWDSLSKKVVEVYERVLQEVP